MHSLYTVTHFFILENGTSLFLDSMTKNDKPMEMDKFWFPAL